MTQKLSKRQIEDASRLDTRLDPLREAAFKKWKEVYAPKDSGYDYDLRGAFLAGVRPDPSTGHWPDTFKKPNHPTFSLESKYATGPWMRYAGAWLGDTFVPGVGALRMGVLPQMPRKGP